MPSISVGMGSSPMGFESSGMGTDPVALNLPAPLPPLPVAVWWSAQNRALQQNPDGTFLAVHPVDQMVQMLLTIEQGSIPALGAVGQRYRQRLRGVAANKAEGVALDETRVTLAALISAGDVTLLSVKVDARIVGRKLIKVSYRNNRLPQNGSPNSQTTQTVSVSSSRPRG